MPAVRRSAACLARVCRLLEDGPLEIDNSRAERSVRPFDIGPKDAQFANTPKGASAGAVG